MSGSQLQNGALSLLVYRDKRTVFRLNDIAMLSGETRFESLNRKVNYMVRSGKLLNPRKGIYVKPDFSAEELACNIYSPSYISLEYVLQKAGIIFQYDSAITSVSYLSRGVEIGDQAFRFSKIKGEILVNTTGITGIGDIISMATPERAFLDVLYLHQNYYFDNIKPLNFEIIESILPIYHSKSMCRRAMQILN
jgi:hypothetical protein